MPKMKILPDEEKKLFEKPPIFTFLQRNQYLDFHDEIINASKKIRNPAYYTRIRLKS
jgi:hypothetical protein